MSIYETIEREHPSWTISTTSSSSDDGDNVESVQIKLTFPDFKSTFSFMTMVAFKAEQINHHPRWTNVYNQLTIQLTTHDKGNRLTQKDLLLLQGIEDSLLLFKVPIKRE